jgi:hypothetical protein
MKPRGPTAMIKATPISKSFKSPSKLMVSQDSITPVSLPGSPLDVGDTFIVSFVLIPPQVITSGSARETTQMFLKGHSVHEIAAARAICLEKVSSSLLLHFFQLK